MDNSNTFNISEMETKDANSLHQFMVANMEHFEKFLPVTLSQNKTLANLKPIFLKKH